MSDLFDPVFGVEESLGATGLSDELRKEIFDKREGTILKMTLGIKEHLSYADAVGFIRGLDFVLGFAKRKADAQRKITIEEDEE